MATLSTITRLHNLVEQSITTIDPPLDYDRLTDALITLANSVHAYPGDNDDLWYIGEDAGACISDLIPAAYWHYTEWHCGQESASYAALCALGTVFSPGMCDGPEPDSSEHDIYTLLDELAESDS